VTGAGEQVLPPRVRTALPSGAACGLAFVIAVTTSITLAAGAVLAVALFLLFTAWRRRFVVALAAGLIAGKSLFGVVGALWSLG